MLISRNNKKKHDNARLLLRLISILCSIINSTLYFVLIATKLKIVISAAIQI